MAIPTPEGPLEQLATLRAERVRHARIHADHPGGCSPQHTSSRIPVWRLVGSRPDRSRGNTGRSTPPLVLGHRRRRRDGHGAAWAWDSRGEVAKELIALSIEEARACGGDLVIGAQTDQLETGSADSLDDVVAAYEEQVGFIEGLGGRVVVMASRELARIAAGPRRIPRRLRRDPLAAPRADDHPLARRGLRPGASAATGARPTSTARWTCCLR